MRIIPVCLDVAGWFRNYAIWQGDSRMVLGLSFIIDSPKDKILMRELITFILLSGRDGIMSYAPMKDLVVMPEPILTDLLPEQINVSKGNWPVS